MIKRLSIPGLILILLICLLLPSAGQADSMISLKQLNESPPGRWTQTYHTTWRDVSVDVLPYVPMTESFPILKMIPDFTVPDVSSLTGEWTSRIPHGIAFNISLNDYNRAEMEAKGNTQTLLYYPPFNFGKAYAEHNELTIGEAISFLKNIMNTVGHGEWRYDMPKELQANLTTSKKNGEVLLPEGYTFFLLQEMGGIPILGHVLHGVDDPGDKAPRMHIEMVYKVRDFKAIDIWGQMVRQTDMLEDDVPLLDFSLIQKSIEQQIMAGHIRKIFDVELGYALYNEPGATMTFGSAEWMKTAVFYGLPAWAVRCHYVNSPTKELRDYSGLDVHERSVMEYKTLFINAQTGKVIDRHDNRREASDYPGFISWDEAGGRP